jgi:hypothetical protein
MANNFNEIRNQRVTEILVEQTSYIQDGLASIHNNDFMNDSSFVAAYNRGVKASGQDYSWHWRVHVGLWAASVSKNLDGDFVECGVNAGFMSSSIMHYLNWNALNKTFYLLDTFNGLDKRYVSNEEVSEGALEKNYKLIDSGFYITDVNNVIRNFSEWKGAQIIKGSIPETLVKVTTNKIAFLHVDLNCAPPEVAAVEYFWEKMVPGSIVLLDDYAYWGYRQQKLAMDVLAARLGVTILSLPTGQGLIIRP